MQQSKSLQHLGHCHFFCICVVFGIFVQKVFNVGRFGVFGYVGLHEFLRLVGNLHDSVFGGSCPSSGDNVHINETGFGVSGCLLCGNFDELDGLFDITDHNLIGESHFGKGLADSDKRLKLARGGSDHLFVGAEFPHFRVGLDKSGSCCF